MQTPPPLIGEVSRPFWDALRAGRVDLQRCSACAKWCFYPRPRCPSCGSSELEWRTVSGEATLYTYTVAEAPISKDFTRTPMIVAVAELNEGVRLATTLEQVSPERIRIGMPLLPLFDSESCPGVTLLRFRPRDP